MNLHLDVWKLLALLLLFLLSYHRAVVRAVSCYQCNSYTNADCLGNGLSKFKAPCPPRTVGCRKIQYKLDPDGTGTVEDRIVRQCSKSRRNIDCNSVFGTNGKRYKQYTCECTGDYCNQSSRSKPLTLVVCVVAVVTLITIV